jgi:hypothetical protein
VQDRFDALQNHDPGIALIAAYYTVQYHESAPHSIRYTVGSTNFLEYLREFKLKSKIF